MSNNNLKVMFFFLSQAMYGNMIKLLTLGNLKSGMKTPAYVTEVICFLPVVFIEAGKD